MAHEQQRGRTAESPQDIPARGWWDIAVRVRRRISADNVDIIAGGLALFALLAAFPALAAAVSIYGLFASPPASPITCSNSRERCPKALCKSCSVN
jgi:membrane protein